MRLTFLFFLITLISFSQDLIVKKDSSKIFYKIIREDSLTIYYNSIKDKKGIVSSIKKSDIIKYFNSTAIAKANKLKVDTVEKIYDAKELKKGLYKSMREFITNSPSVIKDFTVIQRTQADLLLLHGSDFSFKVPGEYVDPVYIIGFCDGKDVYINYDHPNGYCKLEFLGHYSFFNYIIHGMAQFALIPDQLMIIDEKGEFHTGTVHVVKKILREKCSELSLKYEEEEDEQRGKRREYLIKLDECLKQKK